MGHSEGWLTIRLLQLDQYLTYEGLLIGFPTTEDNRRQIEQLVARYRRGKGYGEPYVVEPIETLLDMPAAHRRPGPPDALPSITCIARFMSDVLPHDAENPASALRVIWFKDDLAFPIDPYVVSQFAAIESEKPAVGWLP